MEKYFSDLENKLSGPLFYNNTSIHQAQLLAYSTDASVYQERPAAVAIPQNVNDIKSLVAFASFHGLTIIPRAAGTSLAGQVVGNGIVVDVSKYFTRIIEVNTEEKWVRVEPGVIRDDLNVYLRRYGLMFGPETSTANRAMIGGMVGNNSCGLHSIVWGSVRDHLLEAKVILSDGSESVFTAEPLEKEDSNPLKQRILSGLSDILTNDVNRELIRRTFPKASVSRRNSGYALDSLLHSTADGQLTEPVNICKLIAGSEGTLAFVTEAKLRLLDLPPDGKAVVCIHCRSLQEALYANLVALKFNPMASELVDKFILDFTIGHPEYHKNRFFINGDPEAILMVEFMAETAEKAAEKAHEVINALDEAAIGYAYPVLINEDTIMAWDVRKAGLGLLRNIAGDKQPVNLIEDCAVAPEDLPAYINDIQQLLQVNEVQASYYAHAGAGEIHVEPILNLKSEEGRFLFRNILASTVKLVKKYNGSLSGEHGDGRLRGEFIPEIMGDETYKLFKQVKRLFDPGNVFNAGKITDTPLMDTDFRVKEDQNKKEVQTVFNFSANGGILRLAEKCSGSGDCRKTEITGGVMCPSFMATRMEKDTTRARANVLRQFLSNEHGIKAFHHEEIKDVMDLCLSCKGCKSECPSQVDVAKMKAEFMQHYYDHKGVPLRTKLIAGFSRQMKIASFAPAVFNWIYSVPALRRFANNMVGFHSERSMPLLAKTTLRSWFRNRKKPNSENNKNVYLFCDEFTNYNDVEIGIKTVNLLEKLGYNVTIPEHIESGRAALSKGLVREARKIANKNIMLLAGLVNEDSPLIGIEPSGILGFRDEYPDLADTENVEKARKLALHSYTIEEFISKEFTKGNISRNSFVQTRLSVHIHGHCFQKSLSSQEYIKTMVTIPQNYIASVIPSGCCGMAGSFGYEKEHFEVSQQIGELVLFPYVRSVQESDVIVASGTSCRHQIRDGTQRKTIHPVELLYDSLLPGG